jgi:hypothetical protein
MATKKKLLQAAAGSAGGAAGPLNVEDVFSTYLYEGSDGYKFIENGISLGESGVGGSAEFNNNNTLIVPDSTDFQFGGGDWTVEAFVYAYRGTDDFVIAGWGEDADNRFDFGWQSSTAPRIRVGQNAITYEATASSSFALSNYAGSWVHVACVRYNNVLTLWIDGAEACSISYSVTDFPQPSTGGVGIGSRWYTTRTGLTNEALGHISNFRIVKGTAVYTSAFTAPTSELTAITNTTLLCLQGSDPLTDVSGNSHSITQSEFNAASSYTEHVDVVASSFGPFDSDTTSDGGMVWTKDRVNGGSSVYHHIMDTEGTGLNKTLWPNDTSALYSSYGASAWHSNGYTVNMSGTSGLSHISGSYVSWTWKKAPKFFDVVTYTGTGSAQNISHNLGTTVGTIIVKRTDNAADWAVYHRSTSATDVLTLNSTAAASTDSSRWNNTEPTSTVFTVGSDVTTNENTRTYVAYLFAHNDGDGEFGPDGDQDIIKCGVVSHTQSNGFDSEVNLGFEPQWLLIKNSNNSGYAWAIFDTMRGWTVQSEDNYLTAESSDAEGTTATGTGWIDVTPTGFKIQDAMFGTGDYIYIAIRRGPMAVPESATDVFNVTYGLNASAGGLVFNAGFPVDFMIRTVPSSTVPNYAFPRLTSGNYLITNDTNDEQSTGYAGSFDSQDGVTTDNGYDFTSHLAWMWKRAPNFCDVVAYSGNSTAGRTINHNLGVVPEMMWFKRRDSADIWTVYHSALGEGKRLKLHQTTAAEDDTSSFNNTAPTSSVFTVGSLGQINGSGTYIAYLFASLDGVSKVGSYTGNGTSQTIDCGFSSGARFVLIKGNDTGYDWLVFDTERGIVSGNDARLHLNNTSAESSINDWIDPASSGFTVTSEGEVNNSGTEYIFYAIA